MLVGLEFTTLSRQQAVRMELRRVLIVSARTPVTCRPERHEEPVQELRFKQVRWTSTSVEEAGDRPAEVFMRLILNKDAFVP